MVEQKEGKRKANEEVGEVEEEEEKWGDDEEVED